MSIHLKSPRKIKVIGFPFAQSKLAKGTTFTPHWLTSQRWFRKMKNVEHETVNVLELDHEKQSDIENYRTIIENNNLLRKHTYQAFKDGYFPLVVGGDNTQTLGSVQGMKKFRPGSKSVILDSNIDINMEGQGNFSALEHLTGISGEGQHKCLNLIQDIAFVGARRKCGAYEYIQQNGGVMVGRYHVLYQDTSCIHDLITRKLSQKQKPLQDLWISCSLNVLDTNEFMSKQRSYFGSEPGDGIPFDFLTGFIRSLSDECIGLDLCDVNFEITQSDDQLRNMDFETFRELFEHVVESIQGSHHTKEQVFKPIKLTIGKPPIPNMCDNNYCAQPNDLKLKTTREIIVPKAKTRVGTTQNQLNMGSQFQYSQLPKNK